jgi:hypothetical protein
MPTMMPREILNYITAEPFRPFRLHAASGRVFEVRHPEMAQVGKTTVTVSGASDDDPSKAERWEKLSLMLLESIEPMEFSAKSDT